MRPRIALVAAAVAALAAPGCNVLGPRAIEEARTPYNEAIARSGREQLLLNVVRMKYRDVPVFLDLTSVSTQYSWSIGGTAFGSFPSVGNEAYSSTVRVDASEKPTVTYVPLTGDKFVKQLMSPVPVEILVLLAQSGWSVERVLRCCVQEVNGVPNAPSAAGPTPSYEPEFREFQELSAAIRALQVRRGCFLVAARQDDQVSIRFRFADDTADGDEAARLRQLLRLEFDAKEYPVEAAFHTRSPDSISVTPRSALGVLSYLSQGVQVPEDHVEAGKVTVTLDAEGRPFDWAAVTGDLLTIRSSTSRPRDAAVSVFYRDHWFYVADDDLESKTTFALLGYLLALQAGERKTVSPSLTLDLGG